jgi:hypothetical protein
MTATQYSFTAKDGASVSFNDYKSFSLWFFGISRRVMMAAFDPDAFKAMEKAATQSRAARKKLS